jgi:hypothetical protein
LLGMIMLWLAAAYPLLVAASPFRLITENRDYHGIFGNHLAG